MITLASLINEFSVEGFVFADAGNGSGFGEKGRFVSYDDEAAGAYGATEMIELAEPHISDEGAACHYASEWIDGQNGYRFRIFF